MSVNAINTTPMAEAQDVPLEDAQELHIVVFMITVITTAVVIIVIIGGGSVSGTAAQGGVLSVVPPPPCPCQGGSRDGVIVNLPPLLALSYSWSSFVLPLSVALVVMVAVVVVAVVVVPLLLPPSFL